MYRFIYIFFICMLLFSYSADEKGNTVFATKSPIERPVKPFLFKRWADILKKKQQSPLLQQADKLLNKTGIYELVATAIKPRTLVIAPAKKFIDNYRAKSVIRVLSANLLLFPQPFLTDQQVRIKRFISCARSLRPDIIFLQEVWDNISLAQIIAAFPDYYSLHAPAIAYNPSGLLILSKLPLSEGKALRYPISIRYSLEEMIAQKGMLCGVAQFFGEPLHLMNTHLYSASPQMAYRPNLTQFKRLTGVAGGLNGHLLLGGDLNLRPTEIEPLLPANLSYEGCQLPTAGYPVLTQKLDYVIAGTDKDRPLQLHGKRIDPQPRFSDHNPVFAEISFAKQTEFKQPD